MNFRASPTGIIREVIELDSVDSTNTYALEAGRAGLLVAASRQTGGRGRLGRTWFSPDDGNIYLTLTVDSKDPRLAIVAGVAVHEAVSPFAGAKEPLEIKWPNDLIIGARKICGILCEARGGIAAVGIGLNVNGKSWPPELQGRAASLAEVTGSNMDRDQVLDSLALSLEKWFCLFFRDGFGPVRERFLIHGMLRGHELSTEQDQPCTILGMNGEGHLVIDVSGSPLEMVSGTILVKT
jgi:BirA family transcriptional regulator, biotin operon repressor / biotin---[acetyl-CoA-carboxylase] ligase